MIFDHFNAQDVPLTTRYYGAVDVPLTTQYRAVDVPLTTQYRAVDVPLSTRYYGYGEYVRPEAYLGFGGAWEDWCDQKYGPSGSTPDPALLSKCKSSSLFAPWTIAGRITRGLPSDIPPGMSVQPTSLSPPSQPVSGSQLIGGISTNVLLIGAGLLGVGLVLTLKKKRRGRR